MPVLVEFEEAAVVGEARREGRERSVVDDENVCANHPDRRVGMSFILEWWGWEWEIDEEEGELGGDEAVIAWEGEPAMG